MYNHRAPYGSRKSLAPVSPPFGHGIVSEKICTPGESELSTSFRLLIDTCVWLDLAKDPRQGLLLAVVEEMVKSSIVTLIVPRLLIEEFRKNRDRIAKESAKSLSAHFRLVKEAVGKIGG
ncbi:MAG: hypothetical protein ACD_5C00242G0001, partial [uncultured bacterium]